MPSNSSQFNGCKLSALGMINAIGGTYSEIFLNLLSGDTSHLSIGSTLIPDRSVPIGYVKAQLTDVPDEIKHLSSRNTSLLYAAFKQIEHQVSSARNIFGPDRIGVVLGSSTSGIAEAEQAIEYNTSNATMPPDYLYERQEMGAVSEVIRVCANVSGPCYTVSTACSSSGKVFLSAMNMIKHNICDAVIVGGADSICRLTLNGFGSLELLSNSLSNPFSANRQGINIGESAALFLLTNESDGIQLLGVGESSDAYHISTPDPEAVGAITALRNALVQSRITASDVDYINLHGTGTIHNDSSEAKAVSTVFNDVWCSSTKPLVGHTLGASGATEVGFCWMLLNDYLNSDSAELKLPPHRYDGQYDSTIPYLKLVSENYSLKKQLEAICVSNSFGFGGSNCAVVLKATRT